MKRARSKNVLKESFFRQHDSEGTEVELRLMACGLDKRFFHDCQLIVITVLLLFVVLTEDPAASYLLFVADAQSHLFAQLNGLGGQLLYLCF